MRFITPLLCLSLAFINPLSAEGTRELAPNSSITIGASTTTDLAALHINHPSYNNFASFANNDPHSRLYIHIKDPSKECIYLGFSFGHVNQTSPNPTRLDFVYRIKDPAGNIVFGPVPIPSNMANIQNWSQGFTGPIQIHGAGGYDAHHVTSLALASQGWSGEGDYYIEFQSDSGNDLLIDFWDITVADCTPEFPEERKGRVWSYNWSIFAVNDFGFPNRPFNGAFYVCAPDPDDTDRAFITKIDFNGSDFRPAAFNIAFNSTGSQNTGDIAEDRKSVEGINSTRSEYAIFLNDPVELCETAVVGEIALYGISRCDAGDYCIKFTTTKEGQVDLLLDFDGSDDIYTPGTRDVLISHLVTAEEAGVPTCVYWNGLDGFGTPLPEVAGTQIPITISYAQGIYHFPIYDAEFMTAGFSLQAVRPSASIPLLYYDDSNITTPSGSGEPVTQLTGCNVPCHRWTTFTSPDVPGFGNLNTINSWWFSQRIVRQDVLLLPGYYTCEIDGPQSICQGGETQIVISPQIHPAVPSLEIINTVWSGPGILGSNTGNIITINAEGNYLVEMTWLTALGDTCSTSCEYQLLIDPPLAQTIDTLIVQGQVLDINGEHYTDAGQYIQLLTNSFGCDSILTINVKVLQTVLHYNLDACQSFMSNGSHMDYSEFTVSYPEPLSCADISATIVFREPAQMQKHSCTPGVNNSVAMCISSLDTCDYDPGNDASLVFEVTITPDPDTAIHVTGFSFFEKAPAIYNWVAGETGPNNYPTFYGLRILKNGIEIFQRKDIATSLTWTEQIYDFLDEEEFIIEDAATFRFELLPYCLVGNGAVVAAWDIDEISLTASCAPFEGQLQTITGVVKTATGSSVQDVDIYLTENSGLNDARATTTNENGIYFFEHVPEGSECEIKAYKNTGFLNGVSTVDLIHIQKHLLGIKPFNSPYKFIAADANKSNSISIKDILDLRKLILGIYPELPNNTSWRFGTANEHLFDGYPWHFKESIDIERLQYDVNNADFTAVKIGDLNDNAQGDVNATVIEPRTSHVFHMQLNVSKIAETNIFKIEFFAGEASKLVGMQFAIDINDLQLFGITPGILQTTDENFQVIDDQIRFSWNSHQAIPIKSGDKLFSLELAGLQQHPAHQLLALNNLYLKAEAYLEEELEIADIELEIQDSNHSSTGTFLYQNEPNPFSGNTTIHFQLEKTGTIVLRIADASGRIIKELNNEFEAGFHSIGFSGKDTNLIEGVLFCQLQSEGFLKTIKMVMIK